MKLTKVEIDLVAQALRLYCASELVPQDFEVAAQVLWKMGRLQTASAFEDKAELLRRLKPVNMRKLAAGKLARSK